MAKGNSGRYIIAKNMRKIRSVHGWTQEKLAEKSGLHRTYIGSVERRSRNISIDAIDRIARALKVTTGELLTK